MEIQAYLTLVEACKYLNVDPTQLNLWISESKFQVGLIAKNWKGIAIPNPKVTTGSLKILEINATTSGQTQYLITYFKNEDSSKVEQKIVECEVSQFWYLDSDSANSVINSTIALKSDIVFLKPFDEVKLRKLQPEKFPFDNCLVELSKTYIELKIQTQDLRILKSDLTMHKAQQPNNSGCTPSPIEIQLSKPKLHDEIFNIIETYFNKFLKEKPNSVIDAKKLWAFMIKSSPNESFSYCIENKKLKLITVAGKKDTINLRSFTRRFNKYTKPE